MKPFTKQPDIPIGVPIRRFVPVGYIGYGIPSTAKCDKKYHNYLCLCHCFRLFEATHARVLAERNPINECPVCAKKNQARLLSAYRRGILAPPAEKQVITPHWPVPGRV